MEYLYWDLGLCTAGLAVDVEISGVEAFVRLLDADNFQDYFDEEEYRYYGGVWQVSPVGLNVPLRRPLVPRRRRLRRTDHGPPGDYLRRLT